MSPRSLRIRRWHAVAVLFVGVVAACSSRRSPNVSASPNGAVVNESLQPVPPGPPIVPGAGDTFVSVVPNHLNEPAYPASARSAKVGAVVTAQYIVNADGTVEVPSLKVLSVTSTPSSPALNDAFVQSLRTALPGFRYKAAVVSGKNVRQLVRTSFEYVAGR